MQVMRTPLALMCCLLLSLLTAPVAYADLLPPPDDVPKVEEESAPQEPPAPGKSTPEPAPSPHGEPTASEIPARPSWSMGIVAILAMSVLIFVYLRRKHTLPAIDART